MLFNSHGFLFAFLPLVLVAVLGSSALGYRALGKVLLIGASLSFYAWWSPGFVVLLLGLIAVTYGVGMVLLRLPPDRSTLRAMALAVGISTNVATLLYYKYTNFLGDLLTTSGHPVHWSRVLLPLGLSFIVFQKIAFLADLHAGVVKRVRLLDYCLFVTFFPQLLAGPIVHHKEIIPQLEGEHSLRFSPTLMSVGVALFVVGLAKKVLLADPLADTVAATFADVSAGVAVAAFPAWLAALSYTLQLYLDFSGYCDMAVGLGLMFGLLLPFNFDSPYQATSIIDFWRRWHMSLTRFLTAYLYNPIVLWQTRRRAQRGQPLLERKTPRVGAFLTLLAVPTLFTMTIAGIWHGAGFQFMAFGALHGIYLVVNHAWRILRARARATHHTGTRAGGAAAWVSTFVAVVLGFVVFRADSLTTAIRFFGVLSGSGGAGLPSTGGALLEAAKVTLLLAFVALPIVPNSLALAHRLLTDARPGGIGTVPKSLAPKAWVNLELRPSRRWALCLGLVAVLSVLSLNRTTEFLYFNF